MTEGLERTLKATDAALWAGLLTSDQLPQIATGLLAGGADTPSLRILAGLDLTPFHPEDAVDLFKAVLAEIPIERSSTEERVALAGQLVGSMHSEGLVSTGEMFDLCTRVAVAADYPEHPVTHLYHLHDEWLGAWGRPTPEVEVEARCTVMELADGEPPHLVLAEVIAGSR